MGQTLLATPRDSNQHSVSSWLHQDAHDSHDMGHGVVEEDQVHLAGGRQVVIAQLFIEALQKFVFTLD